MADRFDEVTMPLLRTSLITLRGMALGVRTHNPIHITMSAMWRVDQMCARNGDPLVIKDKLITIAQEEEDFLLEFEAEMRAVRQVPDPRPTVVADALRHPKLYQGRLDRWRKGCSSQASSRSA